MDNFPATKTIYNKYKINPEMPCTDLQYSRKIYYGKPTENS